MGKGRVKPSYVNHILGDLRIDKSLPKKESLPPVWAPKMKGKLYQKEVIQYCCEGVVQGSECLGTSAKDQ